MFDFMQRHRRVIMVLVLLFAGVPMALFFGVGNPFEGPTGPDLERTVIEVYDQPVDAATFLNQYALLTDRMRATGQPVPTATEMVLNETVDEMITSLINDALLTYEVRNLPYRPDREYLEERLKEFGIFRDAEGNFSSRAFNQWVTAQKNAGMNWNDIWDMVASQSERDLYVQLLTGSARVLESELREEFEHEHTRIRVRFLHVEPPVEVSESAIEEYYNEHQDQYFAEPKISGVVVPFSTKGSAPPIVQEIVEQARGGTDFSALAEEHSKASSRVDGGSIGWTAKTEALPSFRQKIFELEAGEVSEPVEGPLGTYIYKIEDKRTDESGLEEVLAREIVIPPSHDLEAQAAIEQRAQELIAAAQAQGGLKAAAEATGYTPIEIGPFDRSTIELDQIPPMDTARLRMALSQEGLGVVDAPVRSTNNMYVAEITEISQRQQQSLDQVRDQVIQDWTEEYKTTPEYAEKLSEYLNEIQANLVNYESLDDILAAYPEMTTEVQSTRLFGRSDMLFDYGWFVDANNLHSTLEGQAPGELTGPIRDFRNQYYFVELVDRQEPTEEMWETQWPEQREELRRRALAGLSNERIEDHLQHQLEQAFAAGQVRSDTDAMLALLGVDPNATASGETPVITPDSALPSTEPEMAPLIVPEEGAPVEEGTAPSGDIE